MVYDIVIKDLGCNWTLANEEQNKEEHNGAISGPTSTPALTVMISMELLY